MSRPPLTRTCRDSRGASVLPHALMFCTSISRLKLYGATAPLHEGCKQKDSSHQTAAQPRTLPQRTTGLANTDREQTQTESNESREQREQRAKSKESKRRQRANAANARDVGVSLALAGAVALDLHQVDGPERREDLPHVTLLREGSTCAVDDPEQSPSAFDMRQTLKRWRLLRGPFTLYPKPLTTVPPCMPPLCTILLCS